MTWMRNVAWGLLAASWLWLTLFVVVGVFALISSEVRGDLADFGGFGNLVLAYFLSALGAGFVLGFLRPLSRTRFGRHVLGGIVTAVAFGLFFLSIGERSYIGIVSVMAFVVGFIMTPLWYHGIHPDFDFWLDMMWPSAKLPGTTPPKGEAEAGSPERSQQSSPKIRLEDWKGGEVRVCPQCGLANGSRMRRCTECGESLSGTMPFIPDRQP